MGPVRSTKPPCAHPSVDDGPGRRATGWKTEHLGPATGGQRARDNGRGRERGFYTPYPLPTLGPVMEPAGLQEPPAQTPASRLARALQWRAVCAGRSSWSSNTLFVALSVVENRVSVIVQSVFCERE